MTLKKTQLGEPVKGLLPEAGPSQSAEQERDTPELSETPASSALVPLGPDFEKQLELGREFMHEHHDVFRNLAE